MRHTAEDGNAIVLVRLARTLADSSGNVVQIDGVPIRRCRLRSDSLHGPAGWHHAPLKRAHVQAHYRACIRMPRGLFDPSGTPLHALAVPNGIATHLTALQLKQAKQWVYTQKGGRDPDR